MYIKGYLFAVIIMFNDNNGYVILSDPVMAAATSVSLGGSGFSTQSRVQSLVSEAQAMAILDELTGPKSPVQETVREQTGSGSDEGAGSTRNSSPEFGPPWYELDAYFVPASQSPSVHSESTPPPRSETSDLGPDYDLSNHSASENSERRLPRSASAPPIMTGRSEYRLPFELPWYMQEYLVRRELSPAPEQSPALEAPTLQQAQLQAPQAHSPQAPQAHSPATGVAAAVLSEAVMTAATSVSNVVQRAATRLRRRITNYFHPYRRL